ncbi:MAG: hypothetical protein NUV68_00060 [Caldiserica bacterium]|jgi:F0F1-type ATP synthase membrane subunit b/b'|nr:hypothetical protein [Caldisericota bacterium]MDH7561756.1 V-type ATPase subunit subunit G family protein [Caldisericota bacterium]
MEISSDSQFLEDLRVKEKELQEELEEARLKAKALMDKAREEADSIRKNAQASLQDLKDRKTREVKLEVEGLEKESRERILQLKEQISNKAQKNFELAVNFVLNEVLPK